MTTKNNNETKFESILKSLNTTDKAEVMHSLYKVWAIFKEKIEANGGKWIDEICDDEALKNLFIMSNVASNHWFHDVKKQEKERFFNSIEE